MSGIEGKVVAITGASGGIGEATARLLAQRGARVLLGARRIGKLHTLANEIIEAGGSARFQALDVTLRASMQAFIDEATAAFGRVDVIVNNAGVDLEERKHDGWGRMFDVDGLRITVISPCVSESELAESISPAAVARAIAFAIEQPEDVEKREIMVRPTAGAC
ncbi:SDR family NAD(P)-dependent oxidoreductase [Variovorax paradoxus]|nr:SDR family NAD(P)-dependent oxidoreductase [Variovorax paradoxus]